VRILVYPHLMEPGGSQLNALELAGETRRAGHEVVVVAPPGELNLVAAQQGLEVVPSSSEGRWPVRRSIRVLLQLVRTRSIDVVHGYEWGPSVELALGPYALLGTPMLTTVMSMDVPDLIPVRSELVVGTAELAAQQARLRTTHLVEPWVDTEANRPGSTDPVATRRRLRLGADDLVVAVVCRMTTALAKAAGVLAAMMMVHDLNRTHVLPRARLLVVGDGEELPAVGARAAECNADAGFEEIVVTGVLLDPRPAYDCADVVLGMGGSALRALAFGKPLIVQGDNGYWRRFDGASAKTFEHGGFYGHGEAATTRASAGRLRKELDQILALDPSTRAELGRFGRRYVEAGYSLTAAGATHESIYRNLVEHPPTAGDRLQTAGRTTRELTKLKVALAGHERQRTRAAAPGAWSQDPVARAEAGIRS
jgi:glycosyltransferase involved in cell wall biosynthesis